MAGRKSQTQAYRCGEWQTHPGVIWPSSSRSRDAAQRIGAQITCKIARRAARSGTGMQISRSKRPARRSAGSSASGRFVAPSTCGV